MEHVDHEDPTDGSKRTRVRFNVEGPNGHGMAYAEVCFLGDWNLLPCCVIREEYGIKSDRMYEWIDGVLQDLLTSVPNVRRDHGLAFLRDKC